MMLCGCCCCWCWNVGMFSMNKTPLMTKLADNIIYINWCVVQNRKIPNRLTCQGRLVNLLKLIIHTILKSVTLRHQTTRSRALALHITFDLLCVFFDLYKLAFGSNIKGILCVVYLLDARHYWIVQGCFSVVVLFVCEVFFLSHHETCSMVNDLIVLKNTMIWSQLIFVEWSTQRDDKKRKNRCTLMLPIRKPQCIYVLRSCVCCVVCSFKLCFFLSFCLYDVISIHRVTLPSGKFD